MNWPRLSSHAAPNPNSLQSISSCLAWRQRWADQNHFSNRQRIAFYQFSEHSWYVKITCTNFLTVYAFAFEYDQDDCIRCTACKNLCNTVLKFLWLIDTTTRRISYLVAVSIQLVPLFRGALHVLTLCFPHPSPHHLCLLLLRCKCYSSSRDVFPNHCKARQVAAMAGSRCDSAY